MPLSEEARIIIGALSWRFVQLGALVSLMGVVYAYDAFVDPIFSPELGNAESIYGTKLGLGVGIPLLLISAGVLYWTLPRKSP